MSSHTCAGVHPLPIQRCVRLGCDYLIVVIIMTVARALTFVCGSGEDYVSENKASHVFIFVFYLLTLLRSLK